jgi:HAD superfamily hydrolase (TIGR01509 family)
MIHDFPVLFFDMSGTFMFGGDRFGAAESFYRTYCAVGGGQLSREQVESLIRLCFDSMMRDYNDPACYDNFPTLSESFQRYTEAPNNELPLLEQVFALHEFGTISQTTASLLCRLARKHRLGLVSNIWSPKQLCLAEFLRAGIDGVFHHPIFSSDFRSIKPSLTLFREALDRMGTKPSEAVFIGDDLRRDMQPAKKLGMTTVWMSSQTQAPPNVDFVLPDIHSLEAHPMELA